MYRRRPPGGRMRCFGFTFGRAPSGEERNPSRYLKGPEAQFEEDLDVVHVFVGRLHHVDEHHVVYPEQRDQQEGGLRQTPTIHETQHTNQQETLPLLAQVFRVSK